MAVLSSEAVVREGSPAGMRARFERRFFDLSWWSVPLFFALWLLVGFPLGTFTLLGPVRWITFLTRTAERNDLVERVAVFAIIALLIAISCWIALVLTRTVTRTPRRSARFIVPALTLAVALGAYAFWLNPDLLKTSMSQERASGAHFTFGPYPNEAKLQQLKAEGYTAVISLLHPAVVPFEPQLLAQEKKNAAATGIRLIHLPMLPWLSQNTASLEQILRLANSRSGRFYVHCYLGVDRVLIVKRLIDQYTAQDTASLIPSRSLATIPSFERGEIVRLDPDVFLTPYPTDEEFGGYILAGQVNHVIALLDPNSGEDLKWIRAERALMKRYDLPYTLVPQSSRSYDPYRILGAVKLARKAKKPVLVHSFLAPSTGRSPVGEAFMIAYRTGRPPLSPTMFREPLKAGKADVIAPHVAVGPKPDGPEFGTFLRPRGVRSVLYIGDPASPDVKSGKFACEEARIPYAVFSGMEDDLLKRLSGGGPYYLYGAGAASYRPLITGRFGPPLPPVVTPVPQAAATLP